MRNKNGENAPNGETTNLLSGEVYAFGIASAFDVKDTSI
jgi:hypothetical protein